MGVIDLLEVTGKNFIGRPLSDLDDRTAFNRSGFLLFLDDGDRSVKLGEEYDFQRLLRKNEKYSDHTISEISRYYDQVMIRITPPKGEYNETEI